MHFRPRSLSLLVSIAILFPIAPLQSHSDAIAQSTSSEEQQTEADRLLKLGRNLYREQRHEAAIDTLKKSLALYQTIGNQNGEAWALNYLGLTYFAAGKNDESITVYDQALSIFRKLELRSGEAQTLRGLGQAYNARAEYAKALGLYEKALPLFRVIPDRNQEALTLLDLGVTYRFLAQYDKAVEYFQQALPIFRSLKNERGEAYVNHWGEAYVLKNWGFVRFLQSQYGEAINLYQQALPAFQEAKDRYGEAYMLNDMGLAYFAVSQYDQAIALYNQSLQMFQTISERKGEAYVSMNLGNAYRLRSQSGQAMSSYQNALPLFYEVGDREGQGLILSNIGQLLSEKEDVELAIVFLKQAVTNYEEIRHNNLALSTELQVSYTSKIQDVYRNLADLLLRQDRVLEAQQVLDLLKVQELDDYLSDVRGTDQKLAILRPEQEILTKHNELIQSAIELGKELSQLQKRLSGSGPLSTSEQNRLDQLLQLQKELNQQFNQFAASSDVTTLLKQLSPRVLRQSLPLEDLAGLQDNLKTLNAVLLYPLILDNRLELVITTPNAPPLRRTVTVSKTELNQTILDFRQALQDPSKDAKPPAEKLYNWLIKPLEADLTQAQIQTIIYAPDGVLRYIPLAALYDGNQWLIQRYRINNITAKSLTDLDRQPTAQPRIFAGAFADHTIQYTFPVGQNTQSFQGLPFAGQEVKTLATLFPNTVPLLDRAFSLTATQRAMNVSNIVHFATHASFVTGLPENSFILFGNGDRSTLVDIGNWSVQNVDLIVLSACETGLGGLGNGEEILGLGYQFQNQGARAVMASLWSVSDGGTQALMTTFYTALQHQDSKAEALQKAQIALITDNYEALEDSSRGIVGVRQRVQAGVPTPVISRLSHPYYWAPFILIGNGL